jgi:hypothetical protein
VVTALVIIASVSYFVGATSIMRGACWHSWRPAFALVGVLIALVANGLCMALALIRRSLPDWLACVGLLALSALGIAGLAVFHCGLYA